MKKAGHLAIDLGASSGRVMVGFFSDEGVAMEEIHRFRNKPFRKEGKLYWDFPQLCEEILQGMTLCTEQGYEILSIGLCSWGNTIALLDEAGNLVLSPLHYRDPSPEGMWQERTKCLTREEMFRRTLYLPMMIQPAVVLHWLQKTHPEALLASADVLMISDYFNFWLSGVRASERTQAATSGLVDMRTEDWQRNYLEELGIAKPTFPEILASGSRLGPLRQELAGQAGMRQIPDVIAISGHDTAAAAGCLSLQPKEESLYLSCGTWSCMGCCVEGPVDDLALFIKGATNDLGIEGEHQLRFNHTGLWIAEECKRYWEKEAPVSWEQILSEAEESKPFLAICNTEDPCFFRQSENMPEVVQTFCRRTGQAVPETRGEILRVILESLALRYRYSKEVLEACAHDRFTVLHMIGGGAKNQLLCTFTANALQIPVAAGPAEATALGNLLQQAVAVGQIQSLEEGRTRIQKTFPANVYQPEDASSWEEAYSKANNFWQHAG